MTRMHNPSQDPAFRLLVTSCRVFLGTLSLANLQHETETLTSLQWERVEKLSTIHRVRPLLYHSLCKVKGVPEAFLERLKTQVLALTLKAFACEAIAKELVEQAAGEGIRLRVYKGTDLARTVYGDTGLREFTDIDFIVDAADIPELVNFLEKKEGVIEGSGMYHADPFQFIHQQKDIVCRLPGKYGKYSFEFHYKPAPGYLGTGLSFAQMGIDHEAETISPGAYLAVMTLNHGMVDLYPGLREVMDMALLSMKVPGTLQVQILSDYYLLGACMAQQLLGVPAKTEIPLHIRKHADRILHHIAIRSEKGRTKTWRVMYTAFAFRHGLVAKGKLTFSLLQYVFTAGPRDVVTASRRYPLQSTIARLLRLLKVYKRHI